MEALEQSFVPSREAARMLGVNERRVRALAEKGLLAGRKIANRWLIERGAVERRLVNRRPSGRPLDAKNAWSLLFLASGIEVPAAGRLRHLLKRSRLFEALPRLMSRGSAHYFAGSDAAQRAIRAERRFVPSGVSAAAHHGADIYAPNVLEGYLPEDRIQELRYVHALNSVEELRANIILRSVHGPWPFSQDQVAPLAVVGADLADSVNQRTRDAGEELLRRVSE